MQLVTRKYPKILLTMKHNANSINKYDMHTFLVYPRLSRSLAQYIHMHLHILSLGALPSICVAVPYP
jgi:hypothetical protein